MQILEEIYLNYLNGVRHQQKSFRHNKQYTEALKDSADSEDKLVEALSDELKELFRDYVRDHQNVEIITDCETFVHGFKMGAKIMLDVLTVGEVEEL